MPGTGVGGGRGGALVTGLLCPFPSLCLPGPLREAVERRDGPDCREAQPPVPGDSEHLRVQHRALSHRGRALGSQRHPWEGARHREGRI